MAEHITLFDLPARDGQAWSLNPWKVRASLNFKRIPYKTEWVEYPDIKPLFSSFGLSPNDLTGNMAEYTIPAVRLPDGRYVMESLNIARELERLQPEPSLRLDNGYIELAVQALTKTREPLNPEIMPKIPVRLLNPYSIEYFSETRAKRFGIPLEEWATSDMAGEAAWAGAEDGLAALKALLTLNLGGPYIEGATPSFADFIIAGFFEFTRRADPAVFERIVASDVSLQNHFEATAPWLERKN